MTDFNDPTFRPESASLTGTSSARCYYCDTPLKPCCEFDLSDVGGCCCKCGTEECRPQVASRSAQMVGMWAEGVRDEWRAKIRAEGIDTND